MNQSSMKFITETMFKHRHKLSFKNCSSVRNLSSSNLEKTVENENEGVDIDNEARIEKICSKSRLRPEHRNLLFDKKPYSEPVIKAHHTVKYNRKLYGKYGSASGVYPGLMWPTKSDLREWKEYENVAYPYTINEMIKTAKSEIEEKEKEKIEVENRIIENMKKLEMWKKQLKDTIAKKEAEVKGAKEKKEKLLEEVRRHFGFTVDPKDERFKEMLVLKEKEMKKKEKQAKLEEREKKAIARLMENHKSEAESKGT